MSVRLQCPLGHVWEFAHDGNSTLPLKAGSCPVCGQASDQASLAQGNDHFPTRTPTDPPLTPSACGTAAEAEAVPGYEIVSELGRGGMGVVYRARQVSLNRVVALKMPLANTLVTADQIDRFRTEAEAIARLRHPHIVQVHDYGEHRGRPFFSMEFVDGGTLAARVARTLLPPRPAANLVATLARAVHAAHQVGVIHRDLKPANVLLTADGTPKISDFGLAWALGPDGTRPELAGIEGTPSFMAPEQAAGRTEAIGPATDVYALGAILYRLLTAAPPFQGKDLFETLAQVQTSAPVPPRKLQPAVLRDLEAICLKCLAKDPTRRYASAAELADDLDRFLAGNAVRARPAPVWERGARAVRRRPAFVALGLLLVALAVGAVWYWHTYWRVTIEYYANAVTRWGVPEGVGLLTAEQVRHRGQSLRFYKRAGRVERVETVNALGRLADRPGLSGPIATPDDLAFVSRHVCAFDYKRDESGRLTDEIARNALGDVVWSFHYTDADTGLYKDRRGLPFPPVASGATYVRFVRTPDGLTREQYFLDGARRPKPDARGAYGERREFDGRGFITRLTTLGRDGQPASSQFGPAVAKFRCDEQGNVTEFSYHDPEGRPATAPQNFSRVENGYDAWGNLTRMTYFGPDDQRCLRTDGYSEFVMKLNEHGERIDAECHGTGGQPIACTDGYARLRIRYDDNSHPLEIRYLDADEQPCDYKDGYAILRLTFDKHGFQTRAAYSDRMDRPCQSKAGYARLDHTTSDDGRTVETRVYGPDGQSCGDTSGVECWTARYDEHGQEIERRLSTAAGAPFANTEGYAGWRKSYDENGNEVAGTFLGVDDQPCLSVSGVARWTFQYDELGQRSAGTRYDLAGRELRQIVVVTRVRADSQAEKLDVRVGDVLLTYAGCSLTAVADYAAVRRAEPPDGPAHELVVRRNGSDATLQLPPGVLGMNISNRWVPK